MAFLVNFRLRSNSDKDQREASPTENGACAFKVKSAGSQKAFHFSTTKSLGERSLSGFSQGLGGFGQSQTSRGVLDRPSCPEQARRRPAPRERIACPRDSPLLGCGDSVETEVWPMSRVAGPGPAITRLLWSFAHGSPRRPTSERSFPGLCGAARRAPPHLLPRAGLPARPAAAGAADPAQRMPVIPLCRLAGVRGHGGGVRGRGREEEEEGEVGGEEVGRGESRAGPAGTVRPAYPPLPHPTPWYWRAQETPF